MENIKEFIRTVKIDDICFLFHFILSVILLFSSIFAMLVYYGKILVHAFFYVAGAKPEILYRVILEIPLLYIGIALFLFLSLHIIMKILFFVIKLILKQFI